MKNALLILFGESFRLEGKEIANFVSRHLYTIRTEI